MNKPNLKRIMHNVRSELSKNSPHILMGIGIAGMITTTVLAVKATPKAIVLIEEARRKEDGEEIDTYRELTPIETVKVAWKPYLPAAITGTVSIICLIGSGSVSARRTAALTAAYKLSETALAEYTDAVIETIGEKKEEQIRSKVAEKKIAEQPVDEADIILTTKGTTLCFDPLSARYFRSNFDQLKKVENMINYELREGTYISLNAVYDMLEIPRTKLGEELGWNMEYGYVDITPFAKLSENNEPCLVMDFSYLPKYDFQQLLF